MGIICNIPDDVDRNEAVVTGGPTTVVRKPVKTKYDPKDYVDPVEHVNKIETVVVGGPDTVYKPVSSVIVTNTLPP